MFSISVKSNLSVSVFTDHTLVSILGSLCLHHDEFPLFFPKRFHFQLIFVYKVWDLGQVSFCSLCSVVPHYLLKRFSLLHWVAFAPLFKTQLSIFVCIFLGSLFSLLIYVSIPSAVPHSFDYCSYIVEVFKIVSAILIPLPLHIKFRIILSVSTIVIGEFDRNYIKSEYQFGGNWHIHYIESSTPWTRNDSPFTVAPWTTQVWIVWVHLYSDILDRKSVV